jgi:catechol 2,3-dioxygenase-like lactoylglutathione lyase family enzyme
MCAARRPRSRTLVVRRANIHQGSNMEHALDALVSRFEQGQCSRRELLATLSACVALGSVELPAAQAAPPFRCGELNHVTLRVKDLRRSKQFYEKLLGLRLVSEDTDSCRLSLGRGFLSLWQDPIPGFDHWCVGVDAFTKARAGAQDRTRDSVRETLQRAGYSLRKDEGDSTIYVNDPDGNVVQLEASGFTA